MLRLGVVEIMPVRHLLLLSGVWLFGVALRLPNPLGFSALVYAVFQGGRPGVRGGTRRRGHGLRRRGCASSRGASGSGSASQATFMLDVRWLRLASPRVSRSASHW